jgi:hypothetical protein
VQLRYNKMRDLVLPAKVMPIVDWRWLCEEDQVVRKPPPRTFAEPAPLKMPADRSVVLNVVSEKEASQFRYRNRETPAVFPN